ncbi:TPA: hypothetical protein ACGU4W_003759 [Vibrio vulnificus]
MWLLNRLYLSDFCAGSNFMDDGYLPILDDKGDISECLIFSPNGTYKSSLLALTMSCLSPDKKRFIQSLQSKSESKGGCDKQMEDYMVEGRPALVMCEFINRTGEVDLFGNEIRDTVLVGQLFLKKTSKDEVTLNRVFFMSQDLTALDQTRSIFLAQREMREGWDNIRQQVGVFSTFEDTQRNWLQMLDNVGLDPFLADKQVDMCRTEGGITSTLSFANEPEFMAFFLQTTMDTSHALALHGNVLKAMDKHKNLPQRQQELWAVNRLSELLQNFDRIAGRWRKFEQDREQLSSQLSEAAFLVSKQLPVAKAAVADVETKANLCDTQRAEALKAKNVADADRRLINIQRKKDEAAVLKQQHDNYTEAELETKKALNALFGADLASEMQISEEKLATAKTALAASSAELEPIRDRLAQTQLVYHARINHEIKEQKQKNAILDDKEQAAELAKGRKEIELRQMQNDTSVMDREISALEATLKSSDEAKGRLELRVGEEPQDAADRLEIERQELQEHFNELKAQRIHTSQAISEIGQQEQKAIKVRDDAERDIDLHSTWLREEKMERQQVRDNEMLLMIAGTPEFNPYTQQFASAIRDAISRREAKYNAAQMHTLQISDELRRLNDSHTESEDPQVTELLQYYLVQGVATGCLRGFTEYLDAKFDGDINEIGALMAANPARFGGLMATDETTLNQVAAIEPPDWLVRPVMVSLAEPLTKPEQVNLVIEPTDLTVYSSRAHERRRQEMEVALASANEKETTARTELKIMQEADQLRVKLVSRYQCMEQVELKAQSLKTAKQTKQTEEERLLRLGEEKLELEIKLENINERAEQVRQQREDMGRDLSVIKAWLVQYKELPQQRERLDVLKSQMVRFNEDIEQCQKQLSEIGKNLIELARDQQQCKSRIESLNENKIQVVLPKGCLPEIVPDRDLVALRAAVEDAQVALTQAATENGIGTLEEQVRSLNLDCTQKVEAWETYNAANQPESSRVERWLGFTKRERYRQRQILDNALIDQSSEIKTLNTQIKTIKSDIEKLEFSLKGHIERTECNPSLYADALEGSDLAVLYQKAQNSYLSNDQEHQRLEVRNTKLRNDLSDVKDWQANLNEVNGQVKSYASDIVDPKQLTWEWPLLGIGMLHDRQAAIQKFKIIVDDVDSRFVKLGKALKEERSRLDREYAQVKRELERDELQKPLFELVQTMLNTDASSFAHQTEEFIQSCGDVMRNLKMDIEQMDSHITGLVNSLIDHANDCYQALTSACKAMVPESIHIYGGQTVLRMGHNLDFTKHQEAYKEAMRNWFLEATEKGKLPQANEKVGDELGAALLYKLLACTGNRRKEGFEVSLVKMGGRSNEYAPIYQNLSSGGELLTSVTLLYSVLGFVRGRQRAHLSNGHGLGMLVMDNPLSKASKAAFIKAQLTTCASFGIQPIFVTGIGDVAAMEQFKRRIVITKSDGTDGPKGIKVNGRIYNRVRVTEEHLSGSGV